MISKLRFIKVGVAPIIFLCLAFLMSGCYESPPISPGGYYYPNTTNNYNPVPNVVQNYDFENYRGFSGYLNQGTYLNIPPNTFVDNNGVTISGRINLSAKEIYKKSDMFYYAISTVADSNLLESGGMLYLNATYYNSAVNIKPGVHITASFPVKGTPVKMQFFNGATSKSNMISWSLDKDSVNNNISIVKDSTHNGASYFYNAYFSSFQWINCDHFLNQLPLTTVKVNLTNASAYNEVSCAFVFEENSVAMLNPDTGTNNFIIGNMPVGQKVTIVIHGKKKGAIFGALVPVTLTANMKETINLLQMTDQSFYTKLKALD